MSIHVYGPDKREPLDAREMATLALDLPQRVNASKFRHRVKSAQRVYYYDATYLCIETVCGKSSSRSEGAWRFFPATMRRKPCLKCYPDERVG